MMPEEKFFLDGNLDLLSDKKIAVIGYGNQGKAQAIILRDNNLDVIVGNIRDDAWKRAEEDGFEVYDISTACEKADVALLLVPDEVAPQVYYHVIKSAVESKEYFIIDFASGYNIYYGFIEPSKNMDVIMVAPRMIGAGILDLHSEGKGYPVLLGVEQDVSGKAWEYAKALAKGIGAIGLPGGVAVKSSFREETLVDLLTEHSWMPLLTASFLAYFNILTKEYNVNPATIILELYASGELSESAKAMAEMGLFEQLRLHSHTSQYGQLTRLERFYNAELENVIRRESEEIVSGVFAKDWTLEQRVGMPIFKSLMKKAKESKLAKEEDKLYKLLGRR